MVKNTEEVVETFKLGNFSDLDVNDLIHLASYYKTLSELKHW